jgi:alkane 1-monooxygenase
MVRCHPDVTVTGLPYLLSLSVPVAVVSGAYLGVTWPYRIVPLLFVAVTVLDIVAARGDGAVRPAPPAESWAWRAALWLWAPAYLATVVVALVTASSPDVDTVTWARIALSVGMTGGMLNVPVAHELLHRRSRVERALAEALMCAMSYPHFCVEHLHGHHVRVATRQDHATARLGESVYAFYPRVLWGSVVSAWRFEAARMRRSARPVWSLGNRVLRGMLEVFTLGAACYGAFGARGVAFFATQSAVAILMLETINYIQHYGLVRRTGADGRPEPVSGRHAWNSRHPISNWFLLNLGRHSDHHCDGGTPFGALRHVSESPQLPTNLFGMFVLALCPPLWRSVMDPLVARESSRRPAQS